MKREKIINAAKVTLLLICCAFMLSTIYSYCKDNVAQLNMSDRIATVNL